MLINEGLDMAVVSHFVYVFMCNGLEALRRVMLIKIGLAMIVGEDFVIVSMSSEAL